MTDYRHAIIVIIVMGLAVLATRIVPVFIFGRGEKVPEFILYLGRVVPSTAMGLLIVYCLRDTPVLEAARSPGADLTRSGHSYIPMETQHHPERSDRNSAIHVPCAVGILNCAPGIKQIQMHSIL